MHNIIRIIYKIEDGIIAFIFASMLFFSITQIILRNFFDTGIIWGDSFLRILVLWIGMIGAMIASRNGKHINIDLLTHYLPKRWLNITAIACKAFTAVISASVSYFSLLFVISEYQEGDMAFAQVPIWLCEAIIPFAFAIIAIRYLILIVVDITKPDST